MDPNTRFALALNEAAQHRRSADALVREAAGQIKAAQEKEYDGRRHGFSIVRTITAAATDGLVDGYEAEVGQELARQAGQHYDRHRPTVPWSVLARAMEVGTASSGGYLVGEPVTDAVAALFPFSTVVRLGAQVVPGMVGDFNVPRINANATAYWTGELGTATDSAPTLGQIACAPKQVGAHTSLSRQLLLQSAAERVAGNHLLGLVGAAIDAAVIAGTSTDSTKPLGIRYTSGITISTGTSYSNDAAQAQVKTAANANVVDERIAFLAAPTVRELLAKRASNGTGSKYLWSDDLLASKRAAVNTNCPSSTLFCGDFSTVMVPMWGGGLQIESNPYSNFQAGIVALRVFASCDVAVTVPGGWAVSVSIT